ncbi:thiol:disulfide interchange protein DsbA/DsbL [Aliidiomarina sanyensis]|uniref:Thiol:disulfide interchange protein n=1 Tax=Aliidiomarina sanyensis TaxID=1249555 RepID=A0A432WC32_9GAMM|nr:thiol:disulfide interchange protein DsbA/DsbL [Aliidiomarina sanyensis]RUO29529.1 disulfide isomerase [Aliidiomarina sanyensis]
MQKLAVVLLAIGLFFTSLYAEASSSRFQEGVHYTVISDQRSRNPEIIDFFSLYCNACYQFATFSDTLKDEFGDAFRKYHVNIVVPNNTMRDNIMQIWATATVLGVDEAFAERVFQRHFVRNSWVNSVSDAKAVFADLGVDEERFDRAWNSMQVRSLTNRMRSLQDTFNVRATPTYIVNRKYQMNPQGFQNSRNFFDEYLALARYLMEKE